MKRTISIKLETIKEQGQKFFNLGEAFFSACNQLVPFVIEHRCWNRVALHNLTYSTIRASSPLGSQMVCNAIFAVCKAYKNRNILKDEAVQPIRFHKNRSVHFDKRTYSIKGNVLSLYTLEGRISVPMRMGEFQQNLFSQGICKEAELICKKGRWYFNLVLDLPDQPCSENATVFAVDLGENNLAATSCGKIFGGGKIRHERDQFLDKRRALQSNGSQSAKQLLKKISGKEARRMRQVNHEVSKQIVKEAIKQNAGIIALEDLTNIRKRIKAGKRLRTRLHRWAFRQLQTLIQYKAEGFGLKVLYVNPAYSSQLCSVCDALGVRERHSFKCSCGNQQHSDLNASRNLCRFALFLSSTTCAVNRTQVAARR
jgi:IS605 OrfB family transposase